MEMETNADNEYDKFDTDTDDIPQGGDTVDDSYVTSVEDRSAGVPVIKDEEPVEQPNDERNPDSDQALGRFHELLAVPRGGSQANY